MKLTPWPHEAPPTMEELQTLLAQQDLKVYHWSDGPNEVHDGHTHGYHKVLYVLEGSIKFEFPTRHSSLTLNTGDRLDLPAGIRHSAVVGQEGVTCLEAHIY